MRDLGAVPPTQRGSWPTPGWVGMGHPHTHQGTLLLPESGVVAGPPKTTKPDPALAPVPAKLAPLHPLNIAPPGLAQIQQPPCQPPTPLSPQNPLNTPSQTFLLPPSPTSRPSSPAQPPSSQPKTPTSTRSLHTSPSTPPFCPGPPTSEYSAPGPPPHPGLQAMLLGDPTPRHWPAPQNAPGPGTPLGFRHCPVLMVGETRGWPAVWGEQRLLGGTGAIVGGVNEVGGGAGGH